MPSSSSITSWLIPSRCLIRPVSIAWRSLSLRPTAWALTMLITWPWPKCSVVISGLTTGGCCGRCVVVCRSCDGSATIPFPMPHRPTAGALHCLSIAPVSHRCRSTGRPQARPQLRGLRFVDLLPVQHHPVDGSHRGRHAPVTHVLFGDRGSALAPDRCSGCALRLTSVTPAPLSDLDGTPAGETSSSRSSVGCSLLYESPRSHTAACRRVAGTVVLEAATRRVKRLVQ